MTAETVVQSVPTLIEPEDGFTLRLQRKPEVIVQEARLCAEALIAAVRRNNWAQQFGNREHIFFEGWAFLAAMYRVTVRTRESRLLQIGDVMGYEAFGEAFHVPSGITISTAESMCMNDEENWSTRPVYEYNPQLRRKVQTGERPVPLFQLRSMAQTRACARALKAPFSWIVAMAGYAPTAVEDMHAEQQEEERQQEAQQQPRQQQREPQAPRETQQQAAGNGGRTGTITSKQASRIWAIGFSQSVEKRITEQILKSFGFSRAEDVTADKYEEVVAAVENAGAGAAH